MILLLGVLSEPDLLCAQRQRTYCNPLNIDYGYCPIPNFTKQGKHRATADPVITLFKGNYYLFSTNQWGYWWSSDLLHWKFVQRKFLKPWHHVYDELCAPGTLVLGDTLLLIGSTHTPSFPLWMSSNPQVDDWKEIVDSFWVATDTGKGGAWDPAFFLDDDGRVYIYWGSSNVYPIYGQEIDRKTFRPLGKRQEMIRLNDEQHGWERFGEHNDNTFLRPFIEGAWMNKHNGKYYLQYGAPGTEFSGYGDGVYVGEKPLGPFTYQAHNPFAYKPGGFARGAGHGATFQDATGKWWHVATTAISVKNNFERRISMFPAGFDADGVLYTNTAYGDYPHYLPDGASNHMQNRFTGWMLLNYNKPVVVSSTLGAYAPNFAVDEDIRTYWSAASGNKGEWLQSDLGAKHTVHALQINYADQDAEFLGKQIVIYHQYKVFHSLDGNKWHLLVDKSRNRTDIPHDYVELATPVATRFIKIENMHMPTGKFALSGLRVFGRGDGKAPSPVMGFEVLRGASDTRNAWLKWRQSDNATGYTIYFGVSPEKLYSNIMVYGRNEYYFKGMDKDATYYFRIEAFNENGVGSRSEFTIKAEPPSPSQGMNTKVTSDDIATMVNRLDTLSDVHHPLVAQVAALGRDAIPFLLEKLKSPRRLTSLGTAWVFKEMGEESSLSPLFDFYETNKDSTPIAWAAIDAIDYTLMERKDLCKPQPTHGVDPDRQTVFQLMLSWVLDGKKLPGQIVSWSFESSPFRQALRQLAPAIGITSDQISQEYKFKIDSFAVQILPESQLNTRLKTKHDRVYIRFTDVCCYRLPMSSSGGIEAFATFEFERFWIPKGETMPSLRTVRFIWLKRNGRWSIVDGKIQMGMS